MSTIRYQVFVSSTFKDLGPERAAVLNMILGLNHFPAGMELFPASPQTPWEIIERVIDWSDYYIVVIAGMYGSTDESGISYTEREYDYAHANSKPIIALVHESPDELPAKHVELDEAKRNRLLAFVAKVKSRHHVSTWKTADDLAGKVAQALTQTISQSSATGWVRADGINNTDLLKKNAELHEENERLRVENARRQHSSLEFAISDAPIAAIADQLDRFAATWFLNLTCRKVTMSERAVPDQLRTVLEILGHSNAITVRDSSTPILVTQIGWALRDELLQRRALCAIGNQSAPIATLETQIGCTTAEAFTVLETLVNKSLVHRGHTKTGEVVKLTARGRVLAERLGRMK